MKTKLAEVLRSKVELWVVSVTLALAAAGTVGFGMFVNDAAERARMNLPPRGGRLGAVAFEIARMPRNVEQADRGLVYNGLVVDQRFHGRTGLAFAEKPASLPSADARTRKGYLAVARFRHPRGAVQPSATITLLDLNRRGVVHAWNLVPEGRLHHFYVLADGSVIAGSGPSTIRMDACSNVVWRKRLGGHHSMERDADGNFWMPWDVAPKTVPHGGADVLEHGLIRISPDGEVLSRIALSGALTRAGHRHLLYALHERERNPFHMNDVEPVLEDGPFWRRGDLFVSLRTNSVVLLYRPATDEVVWLRAGPWLHQHDVDVIGDSEISVFSNNAVRGGDHGDRVLVLGASEVYVYDFATGEARSPWREAMRRHDLRTVYRGQATVFGDGGLMVAESHYGRVLMLSAGGEPVWSYVNRGSDGLVRPVVKSRWLDADYGAQVVRSAASFDCGATTD